MKTSEKIKSCPEHTEDRPKKETTVIKKKPVKKMPDHVADAILASAGIDADKELQRAMDTVARYEKDWERNRELVRENEVLRSNCDHLSSENASLARQVESMAMRIESLAEELAKPEDVRLREVLDALDGRAVIFDGLGARVTHLLDEMDEWIVRAGEAERLRKLFDDAGQGEHNVLALIDHYQRNSMDADERLRAVRCLLEENGCECPCDHHPDERGPDCEVCLACRIGEAVGK